MRMFQGTRDRDQGPRRFLPVQPSALLEQLLQVASRQVGHHQVWSVLVLAKIHHLDDVGMGQPRQRLGLALETLERPRKHLRRELLRADHLDRHIAFYAGIEGFVNSCHPALAELLEDVIASEGLTNEIGHFPPIYGAFTAQRNPRLSNEESGR
jgi:hypothetical protein